MIDIEYKLSSAKDQLKNNLLLQVWGLEDIEGS